jgi:hypothetical protein
MNSILEVGNRFVPTTILFSESPNFLKLGIVLEIKIVKIFEPISVEVVLRC